MQVDFADKKTVQIGVKIHQKRAHRRFSCEVPCNIMIGDHSFFGSVRNVSAGGVNVKMTGDVALSTGVSVVIKVGDFAPRVACVRWSEGNVYGLQFLGSAENDPQFKDWIEQLERPEH